MLLLILTQYGQSPLLPLDYARQLVLIKCGHIYIYIMGNECEHCQPVINCGRQALRQGLNENARVKLDSSGDRQNANADKENIASQTALKNQRLASTEQKSSEEQAVKSIQFIQLSDGITLEGEFKGNARDGRSKISWPDGSELIIQYSQNKPVGKIKFSCENQGTYEGETDGFFAVGKGQMTLIDGSKYEGDWRDDKPHGKGSHKFPDGSTYQGEFMNGSKSGKGRFFFSNGSEYSGQFLDGFFHGYGVLKHNDGREYRGDWKNGVCHGTGTMFYSPSIKYEGCFVDGLRQGKGVYYFGDGRQWEGEWHSNFQNGEGIYRNKEGVIEKGVWKMGQRMDGSMDPKLREETQEWRRKISNIRIEE